MIEPRRYLPAVAVGGGVAGVVLAIPVLGDLLFCLFCVGVMAGATGSMKLWLDTHLAENLTPVDAAVLGGCSGGVTALVSWALLLPLRLAFGEALSEYYASWSLAPEVVRHNLQALHRGGGVDIVMSLPVLLAVESVMGAVGALVCIYLVFPARKAES